MKTYLKMTYMFFFLFIIPFVVKAVPGMQSSEHETQGVETGVLHGKILDVQKPVIDQSVTLVVFHDGEKILMLDKKTDQKGEFQFKNIFKTKDFSYRLATHYNNTMFVYPEVQLKSHENSANIVFDVSEGSPYVMVPHVDEWIASGDRPEKSAVDQEESHKHEAVHLPKDWDKSFRMFVFVLSGLVIVGAGFYFFSNKKDTMSHKK